MDTIENKMSLKKRFLAFFASMAVLAGGVVAGVQADTTETGTVQIDVVDESGAPVAGAQLQIIDANGGVRAEFESDGQTQEFVLEAGNYSLHELVAPEGYEVAEDVPFEVVASQTVHTEIKQNAPPAAENADNTPAEENNAQSETRSAPEPKAQGTLSAVYVDGKNGNDDNDGSKESPVKTWDKAKELAASNGTIYVAGTLDVEGDISAQQVVKRAPGFKGDIFNVTTSANFTNIHITGNGEEATGSAIAFKNKGAGNSLVVGKGAIFDNLVSVRDGNVKHPDWFTGRQNKRDWFTGNGAAVYAFSVPNATITFDGAKFLNNTASYGGAVYVGEAGYSDGLTINITGGTEFIGNKAVGSASDEGVGGAIYLNSQIVTNIDSATFKNNEARKVGAIANYTHEIGNEINIVNGLIENNTTGDGVPGENGASGLSAGGVNICQAGAAEVNISSENGVAIFGNTGPKGDIAVWDNSDPSKLKVNEGAMLGGGNHNWQRVGERGYKANPSEADKAKARAAATVVFEGNKSQYHGAIMSNGVIQFGTKLAELRIRKVDATDGTVMDGVVFKLTSKENGISREATTFVEAGGNVAYQGVASFTDLPAGKYTLEEVRPDGYRGTMPWEVTIDENYQVSIKDNGQGLVEPAPEGAYYNFVISNKPITVKISKQVLGDDTKELPGAKIKVTGPNGFVKEWTSTDKPNEFEVKPGKYTLEEVVAPAGYNKIETIVNFTVDEYSQVTVTNAREVTGGKVTVKDVNHLILQDIPTPPGRVVIKKVDDEGNLLAGAKFQIKQNGKVIKEFTSTGKDAFTLAPGTYVLQEIQAPKGHTINGTGKYTFTIKAGSIVTPGQNATVTASGTQGGSIFEGTGHMEVANGTGLVFCVNPQAVFLWEGNGGNTYSYEALDEGDVDLNAFGTKNPAGARGWMNAAPGNVGLTAAKMTQVKMVLWATYNYAMTGSDSADQTHIIADNIGTVNDKFKQAAVYQATQVAIAEIVSPGSVNWNAIGDNHTTGNVKTLAKALVDAAAQGKVGYFAAYSGYSIVYLQSDDPATQNLVTPGSEAVELTVTNNKARIGTVATDAKTEDHIGLAAKETILNDVVAYSGLKPGATYTLKGKLVKRADGSDIPGATAQMTFKADEKGYGFVTMTFKYDASALKGFASVAYEYLYEGDVTKKDVNEESDEFVTKHENVRDEDQTVYHPKVTTSATDKEDGDKVLDPEKVTVVDTVTYTNLVPNKEYTVTGTLHIKKADGSDGGVLKDKDGKAVTASKTFTPKGKNGEVKLEFTFDASALNNQKLVVFETVFYNGEKVAVHADINDGAQTVEITEKPSITTSAKDGADGDKEIEKAANQTIVDVVTYKNLNTKKTYRVTGVLMDKATGEPVVIGGKQVTAVSEDFTPAKADGSLEMTFTVDGTQVAGKDLVVFEKLFTVRGDVVDENPTAKHEDINDGNQTVHVKDTPEIEKYVNKVVHSEIDLSEVFTYDVLAYVTKDADKVVITDKLNDDLQFVSKVEDVKVADLGEVNDHTPNGTVASDGAAVENAVAVIDGQTLTVTIEPAEAYRGHWVKMTFDAKIADGKTIKDLKYATVEKNDPVLSDEEHEGVPNEASYKVFVGNEGRYEDESNTVTVKPVQIGTVATGKDTKEHVIFNSASVTVVDVVAYSGVEPGKEYTIKGKLVKKSDGSVVATGEQKFTPKAVAGFETMEFTFDASKLGGDSVVAFEYLYRGDVVGKDVNDQSDEFVTKHEDINDADQTVKVTKPEVTTNASDKEDGDKILAPEEQVTVVDVVTYKNLIVGKEYTVSGTLHIKNADGSDGGVLKVDGKNVTASKKFTAKKANGSLELEFTFKASALNGKTLVAFEEVKYGKVTVAAHTDINDDDQTVKITEKPEITTSAKDAADGDKEIENEAEQTIVDTVTYANLNTNRTYRVTGVLMDKETGKPVVIGGKQITAVSKDFKPAKANGSVDVTFKLDASKLAGEHLVVFEKLYEVKGGAIDEKNPVTTHEDINDVEQTVKVNDKPEIEKYVNKVVHSEIDLSEVFTYDVLAYVTKDADKVVITDTLNDDLQFVSAAGDVKVVDLGTKNNHTPNGTVASDGAAVANAKAAIDGQTLTVTIDPAKDYRGHWVKMTFDAKIADGKTIKDLKYATVEKNDPVLTDEEHEGVPNKASYKVFVGNKGKYSDESNTVTVKPVEIGTVATGKDTKEHVIFNSSSVTVVDAVLYTGVEPGKEYTIKGKLVKKSDGSVVATGEQKFTPEAAAGVEKMEFTFDASKLGGDSVVAFEYLYRGDVVGKDVNGDSDEFVTKHEDINDADQTVKVTKPEVKTTATDKVDGDHLLGAGETVVVDRVEYTNLIPGKEYTVTGTLHVKNADGTDGGALNAKGATATKKFTAKAANGSIDLEFTIDTSVLIGKQLVAFEEVKYGKVTVGVHADITDEAQTVEIEKPKVTTDASDAADGDKYLDIADDVVINDVVTFTGLIPGQEYSLDGTLHVKDAEQTPVEAKSIKAVAAEGATIEDAEARTFVADKANGSVTLAFTVDGTKLAGEQVVVFESLKYLGKEIAVHADINDGNQTVYFPQVGTTATSDGEKQVVLRYNEEATVTITDEIAYSGLTSGATYTVKGKLVSKLDATYVVVENAGTFQASETGKGTWSLDFTFDTADLPREHTQLVVFEYVFDGDVVNKDIDLSKAEADEAFVAKHADIEDAEQTVELLRTYPTPDDLRTVATDANDGDKALEVNSDARVKDVVVYSGLTIGKTYTLKGKLVVKGTDGKTVVAEAEKSFTPETEDGAVEMFFDFNTKGLDGKELVVYEYLYEGDVVGEDLPGDYVKKEHADDNDKDQTVRVKQENKTPPPTPPTKKTKVKLPVTGLPTTGESVALAGVVALMLLGGGLVLVRRRND